MRPAQLVLVATPVRGVVVGDECRFRVTEEISGVPLAPGLPEYEDGIIALSSYHRPGVSAEAVSDEEIPARFVDPVGERAHSGAPRAHLVSSP